MPFCSQCSTSFSGSGTTGEDEHLTKYCSSACRREAETEAAAWAITQEAKKDK